jgi:hypothetical protein
VPAIRNCRRDIFGLDRRAGSSAPSACRAIRAEMMFFVLVSILPPQWPKRLNIQASLVATVSSEEPMLPY